LTQSSRQRTDTTRLAHVAVRHAAPFVGALAAAALLTTALLWIGLAEIPAIVIGWLAFFVLGTVAARDRKDQWVRDVRS
jgi:hypothetical protein